MRIMDWSSDVCSSDLTAGAGADARRARGRGDGRRGPRGARAGVRARGKRLGAMTTAFDPAAEPYEDSRRLTCCNFYFAGTGAVLEAAPGLSFDDPTRARWRKKMGRANG